METKTFLILYKNSIAYIAINMIGIDKNIILYDFYWIGQVS